MLIGLLLAVVPTLGLGRLLDIGPVAIVGGLVAFFSSMALTGGSLRGDLRLAAMLSPLVLVAAIVPRLLGEWWRPAAIVLVVVIILLVSLLPLLGQRYSAVGTGLGMATLFAYGYVPSGSAEVGQTIAAGVLGLAVAVAVRTLRGLRDPSGPTRSGVAGLLVDDDPSLGPAFSTWLRDGRQRWLGDVLDGAVRYRFALRAAEVGREEQSIAPAVTHLRERAGRLAERVRERHPSTGSDDESPSPDLSGSTSLQRAAAGLDQVERALAHRDTSPVDVEDDRWRRVREMSRHPLETLGTVQGRHAVRTSVGIALMLGVTAALPRDDVLVTTALMATFSILQASWRDTFAKARARVAGLVVGAAAVVVVVQVVPHRYLTAVAGVSLVVGLWHFASRPAVSAACMVLVSVGFKSSSRDLDVLDLLVEYAALTAIAVVIGLAIGFVVVPALRPAPLPERVADAVDATVELLRATLTARGPASPALVTARRRASRRQDELVPHDDRLDDDQLAALDRLRTGLKDVNVLAVAVMGDDDAVRTAMEWLRPGSSGVPAGADLDPDPASPHGAILTGLAEQAGLDARTVLDSLHR